MLRHGFGVDPMNDQQTRRGYSLGDSYRRAAFYMDRTLRGALPGDLPIAYPTRYELVLNLKTADALGVTIPEAVLAQAAEVIR